MNLIQEKEFNKIVANREVYKFELTRDGIYLISIIARCKNWLQNFKRRFDDDDLAIELDNFPFYELQGKKKEFSSSASWNGNELRNTRKACHFITSLKGGTHEIRFIADAAPFLEKIEIYELNQNEYKTLILEKKLIPKSEEGKLTFDVIIKNIELENVGISASAENKDKLQLKIDGNIEENSTSKKYKIWYWIGSQLRGNKKDLRKNITPSQNLFHSLEFKGKGSPVIENIVFSFKDVHFNKLGKVVLYKDITLSDNTYLRSKPSDERKDTIIAELKNGDTIEILGEMVTGKLVPAKSYIWHKVKYQQKEGYVFSSFVEIEGQGREIVIEKIKSKAKELNVDANLVLALAGCESRYKPYAASRPADEIDSEGITIAAKGIFQLTTPAIKQLREVLRDTQYYYVVEDTFNIDQNIEAGIRYIKWLYDTYYKGVSQSTEKLIAAYNQGHYYFPPHKPLDYSTLPTKEKQEEAKQLVARVVLNKERRNWFSIVLPIVLAILAGIPILGILQNNNFLKFRDREILQAALVQQSINRKKAILKSDIDFFNNPNKEILVDLDKDGKKEKIKFDVLSADGGEYWFDVFLKNEKGVQKINQMNHTNIYGYSVAVSVWDVKQFSSNLLLLEVFAGRTTYSYFYTMDKDKSIVLLPIISDGKNFDALGSRSGIKFIDLPYEDNLVYIYFQSFPDGVCRGTAEIYKMYDNKLVKMFDLKESDDWCENFKG